MLSDHEWLQIEMAARGAISGELSEWPELVAVIEKVRGSKLQVWHSIEWCKGFCEGYLSKR